MPVRLGARGRRRLARACAVVAAGATFGLTPSANASVAHVVQPGETLWSIAAANNLTTRTVAVFNGLSEDAVVVEGQTINVPTVDEGAVALQNAGIIPGSDSSGATASTAAAPAGGAAHTVVAGESLASVAAANGITVEALASANGKAADAYLIEGETITVPAATGTTTAAAPAGDGVAHTVVAGESLASVAAANGITVEALASANGKAADAYLIEGETITVPAATAATSSTAGLGHIPSPYGELHLDPAAADSWNAMREDSIANYGVDLYPGGPASAYRTYEQQSELYQQYLDGTGAPANPPGTSTHEQGIAVDVAEPQMRDVIDQIGGGYGWSGTIPSEWWHVEYGW
jgi:LysM repeat protein